MFRAWCEIPASCPSGHLGVYARDVGSLNVCDAARITSLVYGQGLRDSGRAANILEAKECRDQMTELWQ